MKCLKRVERPHKVTIEKEYFDAWMRVVSMREEKVKTDA